MSIKAGEHVISRSTYQTRGYLLTPGEVLPADPRQFQPQAHTPRLIQITKGDQLPAAMAGIDGQLFVRVDRDGQTYACVLLSDSFDPA